VAASTVQQAALLHARAPSSKPKSWPKHISPRSLQFLKVLGSGMSATVYLCRHKDTGAICVTKLMRKMSLLRINQVDNVLREKDVVKSFTHPLVMGLWSTFQDRAYLYMIMEHVEGGTMFDFLVKEKRFDLALAKFYMAQTLLALEYVHAMGYAYRDLKPENILVERSGHIKLTDMGFAKPLRAGERTYTTCGTNDYMAPEVIMSQGHDRAVDFWGMGVLLYEMLAGRAPFDAPSHNRQIERVLRADIEFPESMNLHARALITKLCVVDVSARLGMLAGGMEEVKDQPFFEGTDWTSLLEKKVDPPKRPPLAEGSPKSLKPMASPEITQADLLAEEDEVLFKGY